MPSPIAERAICWFGCDIDKCKQKKLAMKMASVFLFDWGLIVVFTPSLPYYVVTDDEASNDCDCQNAENIH